MFAIGNAVSCSYIACHVNFPTRCPSFPPLDSGAISFSVVGADGQPLNSGNGSTSGGGGIGAINAGFVMNAATRVSSFFLPIFDIFVSLLLFAI
jgi:hypothetical protein